MASSIQQAKITGLAAYLPTTAESSSHYHGIFEQNRHRIFALAFWMTDNEMAAEELLGAVFHRAFSNSAEPSPEALDRALVAEIRELMPLGTLTLEAGVCSQVANVRRNVLRVHLERAIVQLPATERLIFLMHDVEGYDHGRIARTLGLDEKESPLGLHQARLRIRELVASMRD